MIEAELRIVEATTHGRILVARPSGTPAGLLVGFHGYAETADVHLEALQAIPGADRWLVVAVQALHPFYTRQQRIVANWMTSQDREYAIADNIGYVLRVLETIRSDYGVARPLVFAGFSQGGAMAYRAAAHAAANGVFVLAADVPPDVAERPDSGLPPVLIGRGTTDPWYTAEKHQQDVWTLEQLRVPVESCVFDGGHEWTPQFRDAAAAVLARLT